MKFTFTSFLTELVKKPCNKVLIKYQRDNLDLKPRILRKIFRRKFFLYLIRQLMFVEIKIPDSRSPLWVKAAVHHRQILVKIPMGNFSFFSNDFWNFSSKIKFNPLFFFFKLLGTKMFKPNDVPASKNNFWLMIWIKVFMLFSKAMLLKLSTYTKAVV